MKVLTRAIALLTTATVAALAGCAATSDAAPPPTADDGWVTALDPTALPAMLPVGRFSGEDVTALRDYLATWEAAALSPEVYESSTLEEAVSIITEKTRGEIVERALAQWASESPASVAWRFHQGSEFTDSPVFAWAFSFEETDIEGSPALKGTLSSRVQGPATSADATGDFAGLRNLSVTVANPSMVALDDPGAFLYRMSFYGTPVIPCGDGSMFVFETATAEINSAQLQTIIDPAPDQFVDWQATVDALPTGSEGKITPEEIEAAKVANCG